MSIATVLPYAQIVLSLIVIAGVLLQYSSAGAGGAFGSADSFDSASHTRRGFEKFVFIGTIVAVVLFVASCLLALSLR
jgi:protein translocase SecG subunit